MTIFREVNLNKTFHALSDKFVSRFHYDKAEDWYFLERARPDPSWLNWKKSVIRVKSPRRIGATHLLHERLGQNYYYIDCKNWE